MAYGTVNADVIQTSTSGGILGAGNASIMKNRIINGNFVVNQYNAGTSGTDTGYCIDRWSFYSGASTKGTWQQNAGSITPPVGFIKYLGFTSNSSYSVASGDYFTFTQNIEGYNIADLGWGTANAKTVTLSFWVYSSLTGTFGGALRNGTSNYSYPFTYTISSANTWTQISVTIAGPTSGTFATDNNKGVALHFGLGVGSTYSGTAGSWSANNYVSATGAVSVVGTNGATFYITGVQLEVGSSATGFEYRIYGTELFNCQRYFYKMFANSTGVSGVTPFSQYGNAYSTTRAYIAYMFPQPMRATPSLDISGCTLYAPSGGGGNITSSNIYAATAISAVVNCILASGLTSNSMYYIAPVTLASDYISFSAEL